MNTLIRNIVKHTYQPLLGKYLSTTRLYHYEGVELVVPPEVFHPGFFTSSRYLLRHLKKLELKKLSFLDLGAGSGIIGIVAAKHGAVVTAIDINPMAVRCIRENGQRNGLALRTYESDLFQALPAGTFDIIAINPPYYRKDPVTMKDHAWYCGCEGEYFQKLFQQLPEFIHEATQVLMTVCDGADISMITQHAMKGGFTMHCIHRKQHLMQKNFIYAITLC